MNLNITEWTECGSDEDPASRLLASDTTIADVNMHVQAYAVVYRTPDGRVVTSEEGGLQDIADPEFEEDWRAICALYDDCFQVYTYRGREYVIIAHPHGD